MKFLGKICLEIILKVTRNQGLFRKYIFQKAAGGVKLTPPPNPIPYPLPPLPPPLVQPFLGLKDLKILEKVLISKTILFKKIAIMHGQSELCKVKESYVPIEAANVCNILPEAAVSNGLIVVNLKRYLKYRGHVYFESVRPHIMY